MKNRKKDIPLHRPMHMIACYRSDEICPFSINLCDSFSFDEDEGSITLFKDGTVTIIKDFSYVNQLQITDNDEGEKLVSLLNNIMTTMIE